jgi:ABC-type phosphate transport system substrate-binding protein
MKRIAFLQWTVAALVAVVVPAQADEGLAVIGNSPLKGINTETLRRIYSGRTVEVDGVAVRPVNQAAASTVRQRFLEAVLQQDDAAYVAYWTVRRYIGKGTPPADLRSPAEVIDYVSRTPGALGYIDSSEVRPGMNVLWRR